MCLELQKKIIINSNFNVMNKVKNANLTKTRDWINYRIKIFMKYTLKSLKMQTNQSFTAFILCDDQTVDLIDYIVNKYGKLPENITFIGESKFGTRILDYIKDNDYLYMTRLDSDDLYHKSYVQKLIDFEPKENTRLLISQKGYIYNSVKNTLVKLWYNGCPPFYTLIYTSDEMAKRVYKYGVPSFHQNFYDMYPNHELIPGYNYLWHIHLQSYQSSSVNARYKNTDLQHVDLDGMIEDKKTVNQILQNYFK